MSKDCRQRGNGRLFQMRCVLIRGETPQKSGTSIEDSGLAGRLLQSLRGSLQGFLVYFRSAEGVSCWPRIGRVFLGRGLPAQGSPPCCREVLIREPSIPLLSMILWMDEILHHLRNPGMMIHLQIPTNYGLPWFQSGAGCCPSTVLK